jgi:ketosteroid isomerase-like protein
VLATGINPESDQNNIIQIREEAMAEQHPNIIRYMHTIRAFNDNDLDAASEYCSENIVYKIAGRSPIAGEYRGIEQFDQALKRVKDLSGGTIRFEPQVILADDQAVMVYGHATAQREGKTLDIDHAYLYRFDKEGKIIEGRTIPVDLYAFDEFWS